MTDPAVATVATPSDAWMRMEAERELSRRLMIGTSAMRAKGTPYLPREPRERAAALTGPQTGMSGGAGGGLAPTEEGGFAPTPGGGAPLGLDEDPYEARLRRTFLRPHYLNTITGLVGKVIGQGFKFKDVPPELLSLYKDIDCQGHSLVRAAEPLFLDMWTEGLPLVLVDHTSKGAPLDANEVGEDADVPLLSAAEQGGRPFWIYFKSSQVIDATPAFDHGVLVWEVIKLQDTVKIKVGLWGKKTVPRIRVLYRGNPAFAEGKRGRYARFEFWRQNSESKEWALSTDPAEASGVMTPHVEIPAVFFPFGRQVAPDEVYPVLDQLAQLCLQDWQKGSDLDHLINRSTKPIVAVFGTRQDQWDAQVRYIGPHQVVVLEGTAPGTDMKLVETSGAAINQAREDRADLRMEILAASLRPEVPEKPVRSTLGEVQIRTDLADATLRRAALVLRHGLEMLGGITARQLGLPTDEVDETSDDAEKAGTAYPVRKISGGGEILVKTVFDLSNVTAADLQTLQVAPALGILSKATVTAALLKSIKCLSDVDLDEELERIAGEKAESDAEDKAELDEGGGDPGAEDPPASPAPIPAPASGPPAP